MKRASRLHPKQFQVNESWIVFQLNDAPIETEQDGSLNCICLMDAASCFILGTALVSTDQGEPSELEVRRLFKTSWVHKKQFPARLFLPLGQFQKTLPTEAKRRGISVVTVKESQLQTFIGEARQGFKEHLEGRLQ